MWMIAQVNLGPSVLNDWAADKTSEAMVFLHSPILGVVFGVALLVSVGRLALAQTADSLRGTVAAAILLVAWMALGGSLWLGGTFIVLAAGGWYGVRRVADEIASVPTVARVAERTSTPAGGVDALIAWLQTAAAGFSMPDHAVALVASVRQHVEALKALNLPIDHPLLADVSSLIDGDLRGLLVRFKRVEVARKMLPGNLGDAELVNGLVQIEQALVAKRKTLAEAALNDLKVEARYIETKHGDVLN